MVDAAKRTDDPIASDSTVRDGRARTIIWPKICHGKPFRHSLDRHRHFVTPSRGRLGVVGFSDSSHRRH